CVQLGSKILSWKNSACELYWFANFLAALSDTSSMSFTYNSIALFTLRFTSNRYLAAPDATSRTTGLADFSSSVAVTLSSDFLRLVLRFLTFLQPTEFR